MVVSLPTPLKALLNVRSPNALPGPSLSSLQTIFTSTYRDAKRRNAETGWLVLTTCALVTANRPAAVAELYRFATRPLSNKSEPVNVPNAVNIAALMRESAFKSVIFIGVPRVILSLAALNGALEGDVKKGLQTFCRRDSTSDNIESIMARGRAFWDSIYTPHADKLHDKLGSYHPDFISFIIQNYGMVLAPLSSGTKSFTDTSCVKDRDQGNLSRALTSVVGIAALRIEGRVEPQLLSHTFGLLKARHTANQNTEDTWLSSDDGTEWVIRTVDKILDVLSADADDSANL